jgi:hypothetical protein
VYRQHICTDHISRTNKLKQNSVSSPSPFPRLPTHNPMSPYRLLFMRLRVCPHSKNRIAPILSKSLAPSDMCVLHHLCTTLASQLQIHHSSPHTCLSLITYLNSHPLRGPASLMTALGDTVAIDSADYSASFLAEGGHAASIGDWIRWRILCDDRVKESKRQSEDRGEELHFGNG